MLHGSREVIYKTLLGWKHGSGGTIRCRLRHLIKPEILNV